MLGTTPVANDVIELSKKLIRSMKITDLMDNKECYF